jgi:hypothetical protein
MVKSKSSSSAVPLIGAAAAGGIMATNGAGTTESCPTSDTTFYCKFVRFFSMFKMLLFIGIVIAVIAFIIYFLMKKKSGKTR